MPKNRREYYRVQFLLNLVKVRANDSNELFEGSVIDISATGISFKLPNPHRLPLEEVNYGLEFEIEGEWFKKTAEVVRYEKDAESGQAFYAMQFIDCSEEERSALFQALMKSEAKRNY